MGNSEYKTQKDQLEGSYGVEYISPSLYKGNIITLGTSHKNCLNINLDRLCQFRHVYILIVLIFT